MSDQNPNIALQSAARRPWWPLGVTALLALSCSLVGAQNVSADILPSGTIGLRRTQNSSSFNNVQLTEPGQQCRMAVATAGRQYGIPDHVMAAIAQVESGRRMPDGAVVPWPWSINVAGTDHVFETREAAVASVRQFQATGSKSIDIGCMQVNLLHHPNAFASLEQGFDPASNAAYAARFLHDLFNQTGSWGRAIANYHSATPELGEAYRRRVMQVMAQQGQAAPRWAQAAMSPDKDQNALTPLPFGAVMLGNHAELAKTLPQASGSAGRGLEAYRARPVRVAGGPS